jgi:predicted AAA+ superfamily ATPase
MQNMIHRRILPVLKSRLKQYPAATLVGPRQCGKTTLARSLGGAYYDLEHEPDRLRLDLEWNKLVDGRQFVVLDEAQVWPELFPRLRTAIDRRRQRKGRFLLLGSVSPSLMLHVSESLAGRLALVELTPFLLNELPTRAARQRRWSVGGYPEGGVLAPRRYPQWELDYLALLAQRDLPNWGLPARPQVTMRMLRMVAGLHGQMWNASQLGASLGLSYQTVNSYADYLEGAFLIRRLPPFLANVRKRLVKSPKVYWRDSGLLHALLNVAGRRELLSQPWVGASWEGFVIEQILGALRQADQSFEAYFFRTSDQHELDLVLDFGQSRWAIEIKLSSSPSPQDMRRLDLAADMVGADRRLLISQTAQVIDEGSRVSCNLEWILNTVNPD